MGEWGGRKDLRGVREMEIVIKIYRIKSFLIKMSERVCSMRRQEWGEEREARTWKTKKNVF